MGFKSKDQRFRVAIIWIHGPTRQSTQIYQSLVYPHLLPSEEPPHRRWGHSGSMVGWLTSPMSLEIPQSPNHLNLLHMQGNIVVINLCCGS